MPFKDLHYRIFEKGENDPGQITRLQKIVKEYPYFSLGHFFLLKATKQRETGYERIAAKTALHFSNPFFLQDQLLRKKENVASMDIAHSTYLTDDEEQADFAEEDGYNDVPTSLPEPAELTAEPEVNSTSATESAHIATEEDKMDAANSVSDSVPETSLAEPVDAQATPEAQAPEPDIKKEESEVSLFQPLFATDYFASQGIKLSEQAQPDDKLGKQLKSFTEWLKTMKKVHQEKPNADAVEDVAVQTLADRSNREEDVITESMAEVYLQQGKRRKAREVYEKLSLLNPAKSAYFAAKIEAIQIN